MKILTNKKVLILVNHEITIYNFRKEFVLELLENNYEVYISSPKGKKIDCFVSLGCIHIETEVNRHGINPKEELKLLHQYWQIMKEIKPDVVYSYTIKPNIYGGIATRRLDIPFVSTITGLGSGFMNGSISRFIFTTLYKISFRKAQKVFIQNTHNLNLLIENKVISQEQAELIPGSGVNLTQFKYHSYPETEEELNFVYVGRLMKEKGILELFEAAKYFKRHYKNINFHVLGFLDDDLEQTLNQLIDDKLIIYHGQQADIRPFIEKSHGIIHPSYHEGLSNVLLEAAAMGRPILASDIPGCRETFDEGVTGLGFKPQSTQSLIDTIKSFIELPYEVKKAMGIKGRKKIKDEFNRQIVVDKYIKEIESI